MQDGPDCAVPVRLVPGHADASCPFCFGSLINSSILGSQPVEFPLVHHKCFLFFFLFYFGAGGGFQALHHEAEEIEKTL